MAVFFKLCANIFFVSFQIHPTGVEFGAGKQPWARILEIVIFNNITYHKFS